jgi:hypothetical protein
MPGQPVDSLRDELRKLGYLSHGIERWFALDPWRSRTFWTELLALAAKGSAIMAPFLALPAVLVMALRNRPLDPAAIGALALLYLVHAFATSGGVIAGIALILRLRPALPVDSPRTMTAISVLGATALEVLFLVWWHAFPHPPAPAELLSGIAMILLALVVETLVLSAVFLSVTIHETGRIPSVRQRSRAIPIAAAGIVLLLFILAVSRPAAKPSVREASEVPVAPTRIRVALLAVDGLTSQLFRARKELSSLFATLETIPPLPLASAPERWATVGSGLSPDLHGVAAVEGVHIRGTRHLLLEVSRADVPLRIIAPALGIAARQPIAPTVRRRDYVWEIVAHRGLPALSVGWWACGPSDPPAITVVPQNQLFAVGGNGEPGSRALAIDQAATARLSLSLQPATRIAAAYLPGLDIILNRTTTDPSTQLMAILRTGDLLRETITALRSQGFEVILLGIPGEGQDGNGLLASTMILQPGGDAMDLAPTLLDLFGFPRSSEMKGHSLVPGSDQSVITSYGVRREGEATAPVDQEYYQQLRSLGYIR